MVKTIHKCYSLCNAILISCFIPEVSTWTVHCLGCCRAHRQSSHACGKRVVQHRMMQTGAVSCHSQGSSGMHLLYRLCGAPGEC